MTKPWTSCWVVKRKGVLIMSTVLVHGAMKYKCEKCGKEWWMFLEKGIEEPGENHKPSPFVIRCKCGGMARDISGICKIPWLQRNKYYVLPDSESYFANKKNSDCGVPVLKWDVGKENESSNVICGGGRGGGKLKEMVEEFKADQEELRKYRALGTIEEVRELKERDTAKPLIERHYEDPGEKPYIKYTCPNGCKIQPYRKSKFCSLCGQRLKWED